MTRIWRLGLVAISSTILLGWMPVRADLIVDATASNGGASIFGTLDLTTGQFSAIANLSVTLVSMTGGPEGTLYGAATNGSLYTVNPGGVANKFGSVSATVPSGGTQNGYYGLAYSGSDGIYAENVNTHPTGIPFFLQRIAPDGKSFATFDSFVGITGNSSGSLAFGPDGGLYLLANNEVGISSLYSLNTSTGAATRIGNGIGGTGNDLSIVSAGGMLYGFDTEIHTGSFLVGEDFHDKHRHGCGNSHWREHQRTSVWLHRRHGISAGCFGPRALLDCAVRHRLDGRHWRCPGSPQTILWDPGSTSSIFAGRATSDGWKKKVGVTDGPGDESRQLWLTLTKKLIVDFSKRGGFDGSFEKLIRGLKIHYGHSAAGSEG